MFTGDEKEMKYYNKTNQRSTNCTGGTTTTEEREKRSAGPVVQSRAGKGDMDVNIEINVTKQYLEEVFS